MKDIRPTAIEGIGGAIDRRPKEAIGCQEIEQDFGYKDVRPSP